MGSLRGLYGDTREKCSAARPVSERGQRHTTQKVGEGRVGRAWGEALAWQISTARGLLIH